MTITQATATFTEAPPLSLYIHFPWCVAKCPYCDFNSHALRQELPENAYIDQLLADFAATRQQFASALENRTIQSIFMGGGTPSLFSGEAMSALLSKIREQIPLADNCEITVEANPGAIEQSRFVEYKQAGINRLSLGVQSFDDAMLKKLGRVHNASEALTAIESAKAAGFDNLNIDLMFALPEQSIKEAFADLDQALACETPHISWYQLTLEPNTAFFKRPPPLPTQDLAFDMYQFGCQKLIDQGYQNYEVSAYAKPDAQCRHNKIYWEYGDYLGIGAGAHGKLTDTTDGTITRMMKLKNPKRFLEAKDSFIQSQQKVSALASAFEFMLNALRLNKPIPLSLFTARTGLPVSLIESPLKTAIAQGMLTNTDGVLNKTNLGARFVDDIVQLFLHH